MKKWVCLSFTGWKFDTTTYSDLKFLSVTDEDQPFSLGQGTFGLEQEILMHFFNWMAKSFNFLIAAGYPEHWIESVNNQLHMYGFIQAVLNALQCRWNCFHLSNKCYASLTYKSRVYYRYLKMGHLGTPLWFSVGVFPFLAPSVCHFCLTCARFPCL